MNEEEKAEIQKKVDKFTQEQIADFRDAFHVNF